MKTRFRKVVDAIKSRIGIVPVDFKVRWSGAENLRQATEALVFRATKAAQVGKMALVVEDGGDMGERLCKTLAHRKVPYRTIRLEDVSGLSKEEAVLYGIVLCALPDVRGQTLVASLVSRNDALSQLPFEHAPGLDGSRKVFERLDEYGDTTFISPVLLDQPNPYAIYQQSLAYFEQKCGLRDYLDLYQLIRSLIVNEVEGDIAEFGSFRGHSGWLIARTLQVLGSDKHLYMFDTFESFPSETYGVDHFWSATHKVDFEEVKSRFKDMPFVKLIKGDFTRTIRKSGITKLALAYIDCDSYRATRYLLDELPKAHMSTRSIMVCEDYGHPALLGNRVAVHEICDTSTDWFKFFSQFSGLYVMVNQKSR
jgi:hypothetical protein